MGFISITSSNPNFSKIIKKNPDSGMQAKSIAYGTAFGFYANKNSQHYVIYFKENNIKQSSFGYHTNGSSDGGI